MKKQTKESVRELGYYSGLGLSLGLSVFIGLFIGIFLDNRFGTHPILMLIFLVLGVLAGFSNIIRVIVRINKKKPEPPNGNDQP